ncbi:hypothetical protein D1872_290730 [compost metagenome]
MMSVPRYNRIGAKRVSTRCKELMIRNVATWVVTLGINVANKNAPIRNLLPRNLKRFST